MIVTAKPAERKSVLEEAAGISGIHIRRHEAETRLNAAENNLKRADELKRQQEKQLDNLKKQAEDATKYKEISKEIKSIEAGLYHLKIKDIENDSNQIKEKLNEADKQINDAKINITHSNNLLSEEDKRLQPLKDKKLENISKLQKINLEVESLKEEEKRVKDLGAKLLGNIKLINSDYEREKSITIDASLNEKRILEEKNELLKTEKELFASEDKSNKDLNRSKDILSDLKKQLYRLIDLMENKIKNQEQLTVENFDELKMLVNKITSSQEDYAMYFGKNETIKSDSIKRKERIRNIDQELENWKDLKLNSEKMILELEDRQKKLNIELEDNQKNPEKIAVSKGQNLQNLENTKKDNEELDVEIQKIQNKYNEINNSINLAQEKFTVLRENRARLEATLEGIDQRKMDLVYLIKNELKIENINYLLSNSNLNNIEKLPSIEEQEAKLDEIKKKREALGSVNLRADIETEKFKSTIKKMEEDRADLV